MNRKSAAASYQLIYSLGEHPYLGYLIEPHVVKLNANGSLSFTHKRVFYNTVGEYSSILDEKDLELIKLLDEIDPVHLIKKFYKKSIRPMDFFTQVLDEKLYDFLRSKIEVVITKFLDLLGDKAFYLMSKDGYPADKILQIATEPATVLFHFRRNEEETRYFPTIKYQGNRIEFMFKDAVVLVNQPAWLLLNEVLYFFDGKLEGKKIMPFLQKRYIAVSRNTEYKYFELFVTSLIEKHHVYAEGFDIKTFTQNPQTLLFVEGDLNGQQKITLHFQYGNYRFTGPTQNPVSVKMHYDEERDHYTFYRIKRSLSYEAALVDLIENEGIQFKNNLFSELELDKNYTNFFDWFQEKEEFLTQNQIQVEQSEHSKKYFLGKSKLDFEIIDNKDWFDIHGIAIFGDFQIPFIDLKPYILDGNREFPLPNGEIALIPEEWLTRLSHFFHFSQKKNGISLKKYHAGLLDELSELDTLMIGRKIEKLQEFTGIEEIELPKGFKGDLREYQKSGYYWMAFLQKYKFGGILADDMGLGKTIQTLALLQKEKEKNENKTSLIIMPTSLIYNWKREAQIFTPELKFLEHTGIHRIKDPEYLSQYDVVITTYATARIDQSLFQDFFFHYLILDESQHIKNASSKSYKVVKGIKAEFKLFLSGTPIENSVRDIWSQMSILNPGLLGSNVYFTDNFVNPIEKKQEFEVAKRLQAILKPFILRRTKSQVAKELPPKIEQVVFCEQSEEQNKQYESVKSEYRNLIFESLEFQENTNTPFTILQGLTKLRQLANHPKIVDADFTGSSGKYEQVMEMLEGVMQRGNKVLIFSQFVRHLQIFKESFDELGYKYAYLDGASKSREEEVELFKSNEEIKIFLISIKAGGVGLNLTEADYVFILDPWWNPAVEQQAIDRSHRIGQKQNVFIYRFITKDSVEEKIMLLQQKKLKIAESLITTEENFYKSLSTQDIQDIFN